MTEHVCPKCGSTAIDNYDTDANGVKLWACGNCDYQWEGGEEEVDHENNGVVIQIGEL